jgi:hypothetical protein
MSYSQSALLLLIGGMLFTGTINTILNKLQDLTCVDNCDADPQQQVRFEQPIWQTLNMFIGEALCLLVFQIGVLIDSRVNANDSDQVSDKSAQSLEDSSNSVKGIDMTGISNLLFWGPTLCI